MAAALLKYDAACRALAEAVTADEVMTIRLEAKAIEVVARVAKDVTLEVGARKLRTRAEIKLGDMLAEAEAAGLIASRGGQTKTKVRTPNLRPRRSRRSASIKNCRHARDD